MEMQRQYCQALIGALYSVRARHVRQRIAFQTRCHLSLSQMAIWWACSDSMETSFGGGYCEHRHESKVGNGHGYWKALVTISSTCIHVYLHVFACLCMCLHVFAHVFFWFFFNVISSPIPGQIVILPHLCCHSMSSSVLILSSHHRRRNERAIEKNKQLKKTLPKHR